MPAIPTALLRLTIDNKVPKAVKPRTGGRTDAQLSSTMTAEWPGASNVPDRPMSGWWPTRNTPAARLLTASRHTVSTAKVAAANSFPMKRSLRRHDRVRTIFQVP